MKAIIILLTLLATGSLAQICLAQNEKELTIKTARAFETAPLGKETAKMYKKVSIWIGETDQVTVGLCGGVVGLFLDKKYRNTSELTAAYDVGMAAFKLENPRKASDEQAAQVAGLETVLKTYEAILKEKPKSKSETIEALLTKRNKGKLPAQVAGIDCSRRLN